MSMIVSDFVLDPRTMADIRNRQGEHDCGCHERGPRWFICDYHEGFDAAIEEYGRASE